MERPLEPDLWKCSFLVLFGWWWWWWWWWWIDLSSLPVPPFLVFFFGEIPCVFQGALINKGTELRWQREPKTQIVAENHRFSQIHPFSWKFKHLEGADFRRKPEDFRRKPQIGLRHLRCVTFSSALFYPLRGLVFLSLFPSFPGIFGARLG